MCHPMSSMLFAEIGVHPSYTDSTMTGGSSFEVHLEHAAAAINAGLCEVVVDVYAATRAATADAGSPVRGRRCGARARCWSGKFRTDCASPWGRTRGVPPHGGVRHHLGAARKSR